MRKMNISKYILVFALTILISCSNRNGKCKLTGNFKNTENVDYLYLKDVTSNSLIDSIIVIDGQIEFEIELNTPILFRLHNKRDKYQFRDSKMIWLEPGVVELTGDYSFLKNISVMGSDSHDEYVKYNSILDSLNRQINKLRQESDLQSNVVDRAKIKEQINTIRQNIPKQILQFLNKNINSYVTLSTLYVQSYYAKRHLNKTEIKEIFDLLPNHLQRSEQGVQIKRYIELPPVPIIGEKAIDITQFSPNGDVVRLSDYRGKYVLLEFWASWCAPCRGSNEKLRKIYSKYNSKGFEILSVSGDNNKDRWINAIKTDSLTWAQISDLKGWHNEAFLSYDIKHIPRSFLISPEGIILGDNYCNETVLERELSALLD